MSRQRQHRTLFNGPVWTSSGKYGNGLVFDGGNDAVQAVDSDTLTFTNAFTFESWVYPTASTWHGIVAIAPVTSTNSVSPAAVSRQLRHFSTETPAKR